MDPKEHRILEANGRARAARSILKCALICGVGIQIATVRLAKAQEELNSARAAVKPVRRAKRNPWWKEGQYA